MQTMPSTEIPFTTEQRGPLPRGDLIRMCFSGKYKEEELKTRFGVRRYVCLLHNDMLVLGAGGRGRRQAKLVSMPWSNNIAKWI
jgi:butyrate kinase